MKKLKIIAALLTLILLLECAYCVAVFTDWCPPLSDLRNQFIETALSTMNHRWLATALIPGDIVQEVYEGLADGRTAQLGQNSGHWERGETPENRDFSELFPELEESAVRAWAPIRRRNWRNFM